MWRQPAAYTGPHQADNLGHVVRLRCKEVHQPPVRGRPHELIHVLSAQNCAQKGSQKTGVQTGNR